MIDKINKLLDSCETSKDKVVSVKTLDYLADYTEFHFGEEEKLQEEITYPGVEKHKEEHEKLRQVVRDLYNMLEEEEGPSAAFVEAVNKNVVEWLYNHIKTFDRSVAEYKFMHENGERLDVVLMDIMMPGMDGFELCRRSKAELLTCHIPFLLLTAKGDEENRAEGYSAGADGYIAKPFSIKTLRTRVNSLIEQRIKLRERYRQKLLTDPSEIQIESENDKFIDTLVKAIEQNIDNSEFGIQELCEISRYSYQQVYRKVKALTGESINEFIRTVRLKRAAQYLAQSDTRISEIMYSVGFNSHSYFTKCFREHFGLSPKEYAEKHRRK